MGSGVRSSFPSAAISGSHASSAILLGACWHVVALAGGCVNLRVSWGGSPHRLNVCSAVTPDSGTTPLPKRQGLCVWKHEGIQSSPRLTGGEKLPQPQVSVGDLHVDTGPCSQPHGRVQWDPWKHTSNMSPALALSWRPVPTRTPRNQCPLGLRGLPNPDLVLGRMDVVLGS